MVSKWTYIGYYFGLMILTIMLSGFLLLGIKTMKSIWNKHLIEYFNELLEWNKRSFFFLYGVFGIGTYKILKIIFPAKWTDKIINLFYLIFSITLICFGLFGLYILVTEFYFSPTKEITEIYKEFK